MRTIKLHARLRSKRINGLLLTVGLIDGPFRREFPVLNPFVKMGTLVNHHSPVLDTLAPSYSLPHIRMHVPARILPPLNSRVSLSRSLRFFSFSFSLSVSLSFQFISGCDNLLPPPVPRVMGRLNC